jgi:hypothetical protein
MECKSEDLKPNAEGGCMECTGANFFETENSTCNACPETCLTCTSATSCLTCANQTLGDNVTVPFFNVTLDLDWSKMCMRCADGTYFDPPTERCVPCQDNCVECTGLEHCQKCKDPYQLIVVEDVINETTTNIISSLCPACNDNYYNDPATNSCKNCVFHPSKCLCPDGQFFDNKTATCLDCTEGCATCVNERTCETCTGALVIITDVSKENFGVCGNCSERFRGLDGKCVECPLGCDSCHRDNDTVPINCTSCTLNSTLNNATGQCDCDKGFHSPTHAHGDYMCEACPAQCAECHLHLEYPQDGAHCKKCEEGHEFIYELKWW